MYEKELVESLKKYSADIYRSKDDIAIVRDFAKSMIQKERSEETKYILSLIVRRLDSPIKQLEVIENGLINDVNKILVE